MNKKKLTWLLFVPVVLLQLYVPAKMIRDNQEILDEGKSFKFKTEPIDPNDPFRGKYINLQFDIGSYTSKETWKANEKVYVIISTDTSGYVKIDSISRIAPSESYDYVKAHVLFKSGDEVFFNYPFNRFYMDEYKAPLAESVYREAVIDTSQVAYASVLVKDGEAVIKDVLINNTSIREFVKRAMPH